MVYSQRNMNPYESPTETEDPWRLVRKIYKILQPICIGIHCVILFPGWIYEIFIKEDKKMILEHIFCFVGFLFSLVCILYVVCEFFEFLKKRLTRKIKEV